MRPSTDYKKLLEAVGLPAKVSEITEESQVNCKQMPIEDFRKLVAINGPVPGYCNRPNNDANVCLAGGAVMNWVLGGEIKDHDYFPINIANAQIFSNFLLKKGYNVWDGIYKKIGSLYEDSVMIGTSKNVGSVYRGKAIHKFSPYEGNKELAKQIFGENWIPDPRDIWSWYQKVSNHGGGEYLPDETIDPLGTNLEEIVRTLNFHKAGTPHPRQLVLVIRGWPEQVIDTFDLSVSQWAIDRRNIYWGDYTIQDCMRRRVRVNRIHHPLSTMRRMVKYTQRGFYACNGTMIDIARSLAYFCDRRMEHGLNPLENTTISLD